VDSIFLGKAIAKGGTLNWALWFTLLAATGVCAGLARKCQRTCTPSAVDSDILDIHDLVFELENQVDATKIPIDPGRAAWFYWVIGVLKEEGPEAILAWRSFMNPDNQKALFQFRSLVIARAALTVANGSRA
jgi:hypothetical protein